MHSSRYFSVSAGALVLAATATFTVFTPARALATSFVTVIATCATTTACVLGTNTSTGPGVRGVSAHADGVQGNSTAGGYGVRGVVNGSGLGGVIGVAVLNPGVTGQSSQGAGISGISTSGVGARGTSSTGTGVQGISTTSIGTSGSSTNYVGAQGASTNSVGVYGVSTNSIGIEGYSPGSAGVEGVTSSGYGILGTSGGGVGVYATTGSGTALRANATSGLAILARNGNGNGADVTGSYVGVIGRAPSGGFPLIATDPSGATNLFYVDGQGNVSYHGGLFHFASVRGGGTAVTFGAVSTAPSIEDTGSAQLINGQATVRLDPAFAQTIDTSNAYRVFLTPGGDTNGLYVAGKTPGGFVVRESKGGRSSVAFDYRVVANALGHPNDRISVMNAAATHGGVPSAPATQTQRLPPVPKAVPLHP